VEYLLKAGEKSRRAYLNDEAIGYFQRALEQLDASPLGESRKDWRLRALEGLGEIYFFGIGKVAEAEMHFRQAIALGQEIGLAPRELVRLHHWLGDVLWQGARWDEMIHLGEEGLALLGDDTESVEAALMNQIIAVGYGSKGDRERSRDFNYRNAQFIQRLPYSEGPRLRMPYICIAWMYKCDKNVEEAMRWFQALEQRAQQHHDLRALGLMHEYIGQSILADIGDLHGAISRLQQALELYTTIGDTKHAGESFEWISRIFLRLGDPRKAEEYAYKGLENAEATGNRIHTIWTSQKIGTILLCQGDWERAEHALQKAVQLSREIGARREEAQATYPLGRVYLAQGKRQEALRQFQEAIAHAEPDSVEFVGALTGLEEAYDDPGEFRSFCHRFRKEHPEVGNSPLIQWCLEPSEALDFPKNLVHDEFVESISSDWVWQDEFDDCSFTAQNGLEIHTANGRDLWEINLSAPRILRPVSADFAAQTVCVPVSEEKPAIGGILLWKDKENFLCLERGARGEHEMYFVGCLGNKDVRIGRGRLPSERVSLRLERLGSRVNALCSADGEEWFTVGHAEFPIEDPVEIGLHAIGDIDRTIYHGAFPEGTAIRFESFQLWTR
jgi:tetratricopeptide (TPR) repeat protein/regulation of enolase protein 1 (concanavalin A-like superfamily)